MDGDGEIHYNEFVPFMWKKAKKAKASSIKAAATSDPTEYSIEGGGDSTISLGLEGGPAATVVVPKKDDIELAKEAVNK